MRFKMVHSSTENAKSRARQSQVCYLQPNPLPLRRQTYKGLFETLVKTGVNPEILKNSEYS